jgi:hypothetical protein
MKLSFQPALILLGFSSAVAAAPSNISANVRVLGPQCSDPLIKDAAANPAERWKAAEAQGALAEATWYWLANKDNSPLNYSAYVAEHFDAKESMICENVGDGPCKDSVKCEDVSTPGGYVLQHPSIFFETD